MVLLDSLQNKNEELVPIVTDESRLDSIFIPGDIQDSKRKTFVGRKNSCVPWPKRVTTIQNILHTEGAKIRVPQLFILLMTSLLEHQLTN